jgi:mono/diheme cytochrome c family protein
MYRSRRMLQGIIAVGSIVLISAACGTKSDPAPAATTPAATALSAAYTSSCASCHGADGTTPASGARAKLKGTSLTETVYISTVRAGVSGTTMTAYGESSISTADLKSDYALLKK